MVAGVGKRVTTSNPRRSSSSSGRVDLCPGGRGDGRGWHLFRLPDDAHCVFFFCCMICGGWLAGVGVQQFANLIYDDDGGGDGDELILSKITLARRSIPAVFLDHVGELYDVLALLVLLAGLEGVLIFPP